MRTQSSGCDRNTISLTTILGASMLAEQQQEETTSSECMAFALFAEHVTEQYKRTVIYLVYGLVKNNPDITTRTVYWLLGKYVKDRKHIDWALSSLSSNVFDSVNRWVDEKQASHYKIKSNIDFQNYIANLLGKNPDFKHFKLGKQKR